MGRNLLSLFLFLPMATACWRHAEAAKGGERLLLQTCQSIGYATHGLHDILFAGGITHAETFG